MKKIVMCFGAFDGLHAGHEDYFRQAKQHGDELIVIIARNTTIVELTGELPARSEEERLKRVVEHPMVDDARLGYDDDKYRIIEELKPDIVCLGHDQDAFTENLDTELYRRGISPQIYRCDPYEPAPPFKMPSYETYEEENNFAEAEYEDRGLPL
ncbi:MAG: adenylyltransferase/cytidyltransferase family protein [Patescibacteria group bacterium]|jgi:FAD synthetase